jgi:hypothetical protein
MQRFTASLFFCPSSMMRMKETFIIGYAPIVHDLFQRSSKSGILEDTVARK